MYRLKIILLLLCAVTPMAAQDRLCDKLDSLLAHPMFETSQVALMVYDLTADSVLYERNARQMMRPASTMKLVTAVTALDRLGGDYLYHTRLHHTGMLSNGKLTGDIYCVGGFDPMVTDDDVRAMAENLKLQGIDTLQGMVVADRSMKEALDYGEGWCWDDDNPRLTPLSIGRQDVFKERLVQAMIEAGIVMDDAFLAEGTCPAGAVTLADCHHSVDTVLQRMMKMSDNFYAESMFYLIAAATGHHPATATDARNAVRQLIRKIGLGGQPYRIADGSGLSLYNYVSAELETMLLRYAWRERHIYDSLEPALPIAGVDGTLEKRMRRTAAEGNVRAKTGTLSGVSSLAGYCTAADGHELAFSIINQGVMRGADGKDFQDRVCTTLCESYTALCEP